MDTILPAHAHKHQLGQELKDEIAEECKPNPSATCDDIDMEETSSGCVGPEGPELPVHDDVKRKQKFSTRMLVWLAYQSVGVIYGDIGTSPLYVYSSTFPSPPTYEDLVGALSLIIWALTLIVTVKYVGVVLAADDEGEGGTFALYSLISRYSNIIQRNPRQPVLVKMERYETRDMREANTYVRRLVERSSIMRNFIKVLAVCGVALVIADGVLTPAQSVLGAIQGLKVVAPNITTKTIVGISCAVIVVLFIIQPFGTTKIGSSFAPIVILWLFANMSFGIYNLVKFDHSVLKGFSPHFAGLYLKRNGRTGWESLGGILLAFTGVEALFADMGAFTASAVRFSWLFFAYPCLLLAYIGQAAYISAHPDAVSNPFFNSVPPGLYYPSLVLSILAAFVASQAMITGAFQLLSQTMQMSYFPSIKLVHTSKRVFGQIYIPMANILMFLGTILVTIVYNNTTSLGNAYGVCVVLVTVITTILVSISATIVWRLHLLIIVPAMLIFLTLDWLFLSAALIKVPTGAWFTILVSGILASILLIWRFGKNEQWKVEAREPFLVPPSRLINVDSSGSNVTLNIPGDTETRSLRVLNGVGVFFDKSGDLSTAPSVFVHFLHRFEALHEVTVFFHLRQTFVPHVPEDQRYGITRVLGLPNAFRVIVRHGYAENVFQVEGSTFDVSLRERLKFAMTEAEVTRLEHAGNKGTVYVFGKEELVVTKERNLLERCLLKVFCWMRENCRGKPSAFGVDTRRLVEVGVVKEF